MSIEWQKNKHGPLQSQENWRNLIHKNVIKCHTVKVKKTNTVQITVKDLIGTPDTFQVSEWQF